MYYLSMAVTWGMDEACFLGMCVCAQLGNHSCLAVENRMEVCVCVGGINYPPALKSPSVLRAETERGVGLDRWAWESEKTLLGVT